MPLDRAHVTAASRRTLPAYPLFSLVVGPVWALDPGSRIDGSDALVFAGRFTPIMGWAVFAIGLWLGAMLLVGRNDHNDRRRTRDLYVLGLGALRYWLTLWALILVAAAALGHATWGAWAWPAVIAWFCWATVISLKSREV